MTTRPWIQLRDLRRAQVLLILPCNAAACVGNYFRAEERGLRIRLRRDGGQDGAANLHGQVQSILCGIAGWPELEVVAHLDSERGELGHIHLAEIQTRIDRTAQAGEFLKIVRVRERLRLSAIEDSPFSEDGGDKGVGHAGPFGDLGGRVHHHVFGREKTQEGAEVWDRSAVPRESRILDN